MIQNQHKLTILTVTAALDEILDVSINAWPGELWLETARLLDVHSTIALAHEVQSPSHDSSGMLIMSLQ